VRSKRFLGGKRKKMGLFKNLFERKWKEEVEKVLDDAEKEDLEEKRLMEEYGKGQGEGEGQKEVEGEEKEEEKAKVKVKEWEGTEGEGEEMKGREEDVSEDELISSLKEEGEREEETQMEIVLKKEMEGVGDVSAGEILELGRTVSQEMQRR